MELGASAPAAWLGDGSSILPSIRKAWRIAATAVSPASRTMASDLVRYERELAVQLPVLTDLLRPAGLPVETFARCALIAVERNADLRDCTMPSWVASITSLAVLRLLPDGVTGQSFVLPFRVKGIPTATPIIGYKGYNTLGARAGFSLTANVVREGDAFEWELGTQPTLRHRPLGAPTQGRQIQWAWACATHRDRPPIISVLSISEILAVRSKSRGSGRTDSPWNDELIGFPAMAAKSAKRRLGRDLALEGATPLGVDYAKAQALDERVEEMGRVAYLRSDGQLVEAEEGEWQTNAPGDITQPQEWRIDLIAPDSTVYRELRFTSSGAWRMQWRKIVEAAGDNKEGLGRYLAGNEAHLEAAGQMGDEIRRLIMERLEP